MLQSLLVNRLKIFPMSPYLKSMLHSLPPVHLNLMAYIVCVFCRSKASLTFTSPLLISSMPHLQRICIRVQTLSMVSPNHAYKIQNLCIEQSKWTYPLKIKTTILINFHCLSELDPYSVMNQRSLWIWHVSRGNLIVFCYSLPLLNVSTFDSSIEIIFLSSNALV